MPLYDFKCRSCGHEFESLVRAASYGDPPTTCPQCRTGDPERLLSTFAVSSADMRKASAAAKTKKAAEIGRRETAAMDREVQQHRHEDH